VRHSWALLLDGDLACCVCLVVSPTNVQNADELLVARTPFDSRLYSRSMSGVAVTSPTSSSSIVSSLLLLDGFTLLSTVTEIGGGNVLTAVCLFVHLFANRNSRSCG